MALSALDLFSIGIGPSSSHTVGPMRAAHLFLTELAGTGLRPGLARVCTELSGRSPSRAAATAPTGRSSSA